MFYLVFSIFCSVLVSILLKISRRHHIDVRQAIASNYIMASGLTILLLKPRSETLFQAQTPYLTLIFLGILLPSIFFVMARAVEQVGIVRSDAAQRLSLLIPLLAAFVLFQEPFNSVKLAGIVCGLAAIIALTLFNQSSQKQTATGHSALLLFGVWAGYGVIDVLFKQLAKSGLAFTSSLIMSFVLAGVIMFSTLLIKKIRWHKKSLAAGLFLGLFNFGNIFFYIRAHQSFPENPAVVFASMNIGVIVLGTLTGVLLFKERATGPIAIGLLLAVTAIMLLLP